MIVFVSNFYNHHQAPLSRALYRLSGGNYRFIATSSMDDERRNMGWDTPSDEFVLEYDSSQKYAQELIDTADAVIYGSAPEKLIKKRLSQKRLVFKYSERIHRKKEAWYLYLPRLLNNYIKWGGKRSLYLLSTGAYSASDFARTGTFRDKAYRFGYFPKTIVYDTDTLILAKRKENSDTVSLLWVGRMIELKHPEKAVLLADRLRSRGINFVLNMIGSGDEEQRIADMIAELELVDYVKLYGFTQTERIREFMEMSDIFLFTSDRAEGWGAVVNEAMNSACAVVADREAGSVPYLIEHGVNGYIYDSLEELFEYTLRLAKDMVLRESFGKEAYKTIAKKWDADIAATRLMCLTAEIARHGFCELYSDGPCSRIKKGEQ